MTADTELLRLPPTHLSAHDDALIVAAGRWGEVLGGGPLVRDDSEAAELTELSGALERLNHEYAAAGRAAGLTIGPGRSSARRRCWRSGHAWRLAAKGRSSSAAYWPSHGPA